MEIRSPLILLLGILFLAGNARAGDDMPPLFTTILDASPKPPPRVLASYPVAINFEDLSSGPLELFLELPGFGTFTATQISFEITDEGYNWVGRTSEQEVVLTVHEPFITGFIRGSGETFSILSAPDGGDSATYVLQRMDEQAFPPDLVLASDKASRAFRGFDPSTECVGSPTQPLNILMLYSPEVLALAGSEMNLLSQIANAALAAQATIDNSDIPATIIGSVEPAPVTLIQQGNVNDYVNLLNNPDVQQMRRSAEADIVVYLVEELFSGPTEFCGVTVAMQNGGVHGTRSAGYSYYPYAMNVLSYQCGLQNNDLSHEVGHNLGLLHNPGFNSPATEANALFPFAFGHFVDGEFRTDMSGEVVMGAGANCPNTCAREMYFSNPDITLNGFPTGIVGARDNADVYERVYTCVNDLHEEMVFTDSFSDFAL